MRVSLIRMTTGQADTLRMLLRDIADIRERRRDGDMLPAELEDDNDTELTCAEEIVDILMSVGDLTTTRDGGA